MKISKLLIVSVLFGVSALNADMIEDKYKSLIGKSIFTSNVYNLKSGHYKFDADGGDKPEMVNSNFVGSYMFGDKYQIWRPFVEGGFGFSTIEQDNLSIGRGTTGDRAKFKSVYYKIGGGLSYSPNCDFSIIAGGNALWMDSDGSYKSSIPLGSSSTDKKIKKLFDDDSQNSIYDIYGGFAYHPLINGYHTEFISFIHHTSIDFDHGLDKEEGVYLNMLARVHGHEFARILDQPLWLEYYAGGDLLDSNLADLVGFDSALTIGSSLHWRFAPLVPFLRANYKDLDLAFNVQGTVSNTDYQGWKVSLGLSLVKF